MPEVSSNNKRIAKNTLLLYFRMMLLMLVSLYTSRVVLNLLGVVDYGIYNVVGGLVSLGSILTNSLAASCSRFITFSLGKNDMATRVKVYSTSVLILTSLATIFIIIAEIVGVWFLNHKMNIPIERMGAASIVLQCSIIAFAINLISVPYNASIIAHEKMSIYAYISILEAFLKLLLVLALYITPFDKLISYAVFVVAISVLIRYLYSRYCNKNFVECHFKFVYDKKQLCEMFSFAGWSFIGCSAQSLLSQGVNVITNLFFNVTLNASRGIATQIEAAVKQFVNSFTTALNPQITKSYATGDVVYMLQLVYQGAKYSYFLSLFFALPILTETDLILKIWLGNIPEYAPLFVKWTILIIMTEVLSETIIKANAATGKIKKYQLIVGGYNMLIFPLTYICFQSGMPAVSSYVVHFFIFLTNLFVRIKLMKEIVPMTFSDYTKQVLLKIIPITILAFILPILFIYTMDGSILRFVLICLITIIELPLLIYFFGLGDSEKRMILNVLDEKVLSKLK